jgi:hypothetical protein
MEAVCNVKLHVRIFWEVEIEKFFIETFGFFYRKKNLNVFARNPH